MYNFNTGLHTLSSFILKTWITYNLFSLFWALDVGSGALSPNQILGLSGVNKTY